MSELSIAPPEAVPSSAKHNSESDNTLGYNVILLKNDRLFFMRKAELSFKINDAELATSAAWNIKNNADFLDQEVGIGGLFATQEEDEPNIYGPPIKMGNHTIWQVTGASDPQANKIKLLCGDKFLVSHFAGGKPDILLVSQHYHECASFYKKGKEGKDKGKRPFDSLAEECSMENSWPTKAFRSSTLRRGARPTGVSSLLRTGRLNGTGTTERKVNSITHTSCATPKEVPLRSDPESQLHDFVAGVSSANGNWIYAIWLPKDTRVYLCYYRQSRVVIFDRIGFIESFTRLVILDMFHIKREVQAGFSLNPITGCVHPFDAKFLCHEDGALFQLVENADLRKGQIHTYYSLLIRGTDVHNIDVTGNASKDTKLIVSSSWKTSTRDQERVFIAEVRKIETNHLVQIYRKATGGSDSPPGQLRETCSRTSQEYEKKGILLLLGNPISKIEVTVIFRDVFMQCQRCAHKLYPKGSFLYRDVSINDLGFYITDNEEYKGIFLDFDLASVEGTPKPTRVRSGTSFFMAREALDVSKAYAHRFRHDLESLLYVLIWHTLGYRQENAEQDVMYEWRRGSWNSNMEAKDFFIVRDWMDIFPSAGADEGFLHIRCRSICYAYFSVAHDLARKEASSAKFLFQKAPKEAQEELDSSATEDAVTFRHWLKRIGETVDETCDKDCCLCSE